MASAAGLASTTTTGRAGAARGDLRWISADQEYGPEESGPEGCEFLLVSYGPMDVQWEGGDRQVVEG
jgi:hypothetical protein